MFKLSVSIAALMLCAVSNANASPDGHWLRKECSREVMKWGMADITEKNKVAVEKAWENNFDRAKCRQYVFGVIDGLDLFGTIYKQGICLPTTETVTTEQTYKILVQYMDKHPEDWGKPAAFIIASAMREVWPCKKQTFEQVK